MTEEAIMESSAVRARVPAKINLHLGVSDVRPDGYHRLRTVYQAISVYDELIVKNAPTLRMSLTGEGEGELPLDDDNLVIRAARALAEEHGVTAGADIQLHKRIPLAGGLAGGSADAAGALLACARLWGVDVDTASLAAIGARLGSDIPFCLYGGNALGTGHGERIESLPVGATLHWVVAVADGQLSTPRVYSELDYLRAAGVGEYHGDTDALVTELRVGDAESVAPLLHNDMQAAAIGLRPAIAEVLDVGLADGALAGMVSGSGPTVLLLARDDHHAHALAGRVRLRGVARDVLTAHGPVQGAHLY